MAVIQATVVASFVLVHLFAGRLRFLDRTPRSRWLSFAGGISVAYVFVHVFPDLAETQEQMHGGWRLVPWVEHHAYLVALLGLVSFYGLERLVKSNHGAPPRSQHPSADETAASRDVFWLHIGSFTLYNGLVGYLLVHREQDDLRGLLTYAFAMGLHFLVNDYGLRKDHRATYRRVGRWVLAAGIVLGWGFGLVTSISEMATGVLFALLAGGVILNVLKEEVPEERQSHFLPFMLGRVRTRRCYWRSSGLRPGCRPTMELFPLLDPPSLTFRV